MSGCRIFLCRLCRQDCDFQFDIFNPDGTNGLLLWKVLEELLQLEVYEDDGLPVTMCQDCAMKVAEFKHFKSMCLESRTEFLKDLDNRRVVDLYPMVFEGFPDLEYSLLDGDEIVESSTVPGLSAECVHEETIHEKLSMEFCDHSLELSREKSESAPQQAQDLHIDSEDNESLDLHEDEEDFDLRLILDSSSEDDNSDNVQSCGAKEEHDSGSQSLTREEAQGVEALPEDESRLTSLYKVISVPSLVGNVVDGCSNAGGSSKICEEIVSELRDGRNKNKIKKFERNTSLSALRGEHRLRIVEKFSAKKGESLKSGDCITIAPKLNDMMPSEQRHLDSHKKQLAGRRAFICDQCGVKYTDKKKLLTHVVGHISRNMPSASVVPSLKCIESGITGIQSSKQFKCEMCEMEFKSKYYLTRHYVVHCNLKPFQCKTCGNFFKTKAALLVHSKYHLHSELFKCDCCRKGFTSMSTLAAHLVIHSGSRPFKCDTCGKGFAWKSSLVTHSVMHSSLRPFKCETCGKGFARKSYLVKHSVIHSGLRPYKCDTCGKDFTRKNDLCSHLVIHSDLRPFKCDTCGKGFPRKCDLDAHSVMHSSLRPFKCETCGKGFVRKSYLVKHSVIHSGLKPYKCDTCGKDFKRKNELCRHLVMHSGLRPFKCDVCRKGFARKYDLDAHSIMHSSLRPFKCETCGKGFARKADLVKHTVMHNSLRPYKCDTCGKDFKRKNDLWQHLVMHSGLRPFRCETCGMKFKRRTGLWTHSIKHK